MSFVSHVLSLVWLRVYLASRQKFAWISLISGAVLFFISYLMASSSYVLPLKIFWDSCLGIIFVAQSLMIIIFSSFIFHNECERKTLHITLSAGVSRSSWLVGNTLGLWLVVSLLGWFWFFFSWALSNLIHGEISFVMIFQAQLLLNFELLLLAFAGMFFSLFLRPSLAFFLLLACSIFLHSQTSLIRILTNKQTQVFVSGDGQHILFWLTKFLPPLEWFDLRIFVGFEEFFPWVKLGAFALMALGWSFFLAYLAIWRFRRIDL